MQLSTENIIRGREYYIGHTDKYLYLCNSDTNILTQLEVKTNVITSIKLQEFETHCYVFKIILYNNIHYLLVRSIPDHKCYHDSHIYCYNIDFTKCTSVIKMKKISLHNFIIKDDVIHCLSDGTLLLININNNNSKEYDLYDCVKDKFIVFNSQLGASADSVVVIFKNYEQTIISEYNIEAKCSSYVTDVLSKKSRTVFFNNKIYNYDTKCLRNINDSKDVIKLRTEMTNFINDDQFDIYVKVMNIISVNDTLYLIMAPYLMYKII